MKKIKLKLSDLLRTNYALEKIINDNENKKIDSLFKFKVLGILKAIEDYIANYNLIRNQKIQEYGKTDNNGNTSILPNDTKSIEKFNKDMIPILDSYLEIEITPLSQEEVFFKDLDSKILIGLYPIISDK